ncbi:hypothetical protein [Hyalangium rubrum]|uniref:Uncharacterized protein n=1 Tax=Hyalangium rubrum TaxID=3103134 RepID=A0ABU5HE05_9BACT|nr:hypothetical protein [Hyalangium sp. s54d21]MDY7231711.1 hypothetical protein [Hyalangium sp. s54d21]
MLNTRFLSAVSLSWSKPSARIVTRGASGVRCFSVTAGHIVSSESTVPSEGLLALLAAEDKLDRGLVGLLGAAAAKRGIPPEHLLIEEKLIHPAEVVGALERLATAQFRAAMMGEGQAAAATGAVGRGTIRLHLGALLLEQFRALPSDVIRHYLGGASGALKLHAGEDTLGALRLQPAELRAARQAEVLLSDAQNDRAVRLGGALLALGLATWHP